MPELTIKEIKKVIDQGFQKQAVMINSAFQGHTEHMDNRFEKIEGRLEGVEDRLERVETKLDRALHVEYVNLEVRVKRIENKIGLKPINNQPKTA